MTAPSILVTERAWGEWGGRLRPAAPLARWSTLDEDATVRLVADGPLPVEASTPEPLATWSEGAEVVWLSNDVFRSPALGPLAEHLRASRTLRWVQSGAAGTDVPLFRDLIARGVRFSTSHVTAIPIAEYVVGSVLRLFQQPEAWAEAAAERAWRHHDFREVHGTTWLVVGLGAIGGEVAVRARALGATVVGVRRSPTGSEPVDRMIAPSAVPGALPAADVVVLAAPGGPDTDGLVDDAFLAAMAADAVLVNVARGSLVDEAALRRALDAGRPGHAVLDVAAVEPPPADSFLWDHPRVTLTPHASGGGRGRYGRSADVFRWNLGRYLAGARLEDEVAP